MKPSWQRFKQVLEKGLRKGRGACIVCNCGVEYKGRAVSRLKPGDRFIIIKPDRTTLVHQPSGRNPVNWMPPNSSIKVEDGGVLLVENVNPREFMRVMVNQVHVVIVVKMVDTVSLEQVGSEADMARMIYDNPNLLEKGFKPASLEEQTRYGFIDVFGKDSVNNLVVVECKRYKAGLDAVQQLRRYVERVKKNTGNNNVRGILAAPSISSNAVKMLSDWGFQYKQVHPPMHLIPDREVQKGLSEYLKKDG